MDKQAVEILALQTWCCWAGVLAEALAATTDVPPECQNDQTE